MTETRRGPLLAVAAGESAAGTWTVLHVAVKARLPATSPVTAGVVVDLGPGAEEAKEGVFSRTGHDTDVSVPHHKIRRLGTRYALKSFHPGIEILRVGVFVGESCSLVDSVNQMGAIVSVAACCFGVKGDINH